MLALPITEYQIGIICALPKEAAAVVAILDERHEDLEKQESGDYNTYTLGRIHRHYVVISCLPAGIYGTNVAATSAKDMLRTFTGIRFGLMIGIGGGIPSLPEDDIRLGDVVVSQPDRTHGGVVQYDLAKRHGREGFERKGSLNKPPIALLTALAKLQTQHHIENSKMSTYIREATQKMSPSTGKNYGLPDPETDHLHCSRCSKSQWWWRWWLLLVWLFTLWRCELCNYGLIIRKRRRSVNPTLHYGTIASGNLLIKDAVFRDRLREELGAKCVEMEAAGLMDDFRCLVVRGICDYADLHKDDAWQNYAALTAAAFAKELLGYVVPAEVNNEIPLNGIINVLEKQVGVSEELLYETRQQNDRNERRHYDERHRACRQALRTSVYEEFKNNITERTEGTCGWVFNHPTFRQWDNSPKDDLLWISADPGCGKSVLARSTVDHKLQVEGTYVCYFFFKDNELQDNLPTALCALLHQLFDLEPRLTQHAMQAWEKNGNHLLTGVDELWRILLSAARESKVARIAFVLDALDECKPADRARLIHKLRQFHEISFLEHLSGPATEARQARIKFLVTSRPYDDIEHEFRLPHHLPAIRLRGEDENDEINREINMVINRRVDDLATELELDSYTKERLRTQLLQMQHRTYLWLHLAIGSIRETFRNSPRPALETVNFLPSSVDDAYEKILSRVGKNNKDTVESILKIVIGARRPFTVGEMAIALGIATSKQFGKLEDVTLDVNHLARQIRDWCGLFIFINHSRIYLIHQTAKEFLMCKPELGSVSDVWKHRLRPLEIERLLARICVEVLSFDEMEATGRALADRLRQRSYMPADDLLDADSSAIKCIFVYSAVNWAAHVQTAPLSTDKELLAAVLKVYDTSGKLFDSWFRIFWHSLRWTRKYLPTYLNTTAVCLAAMNGHHSVLHHLFQHSEIDANQKDGRGIAAIVWASLSGHEDTVDLLLDKGANVNIQTNPRVGTALAVAAYEGHVDIVKMLLERGAVIEAGNHAIYGDALEAASNRNHFDIVELLLDGGADVDTPSNSVYGNALSAASANDNVKVIELLLDRGASINRSKQGPRGNPLIVASVCGDTETVRLLLDRGADVNTQDREGEAVIEIAFRERRFDIVRLLIARGASDGQKYLAKIKEAEKGQTNEDEEGRGGKSKLNHSLDYALLGIQASMRVLI